MKKIFPGVLLGILVIAFFYKTIFFGLLPFPGDLLIAEYKPWSSYSYLGYSPGSYPNKAQYFDTLRQLYPWTTFAVKEIRDGRIPFWNPHNFSGTPLAANFQSSIFYPFEMLFFPFSQPFAWTLLIILQPLLACIFTYFYCQKMKLSLLASSFVAVSYAFSSFMTVWLEYNTIGHVILWLPLILLSIEHLRERTNRRWILILIVSIISSFLAGHPQVFFYLLIFCFIYGLVRIPGKSRKIILGLCMLVAIGISAFQLLPGLELFTYAARSPLAYEEIIHKVLIQPWQLIMLVVPDFFGNPATRTYWPSDTYVGDVISIGIIPLFFFLAMLRSRFELKNFFLVALITILVLTTNNPFTQLLYRINIPILTSSSPTLMIFLFQFSLALLCGYGIDRFRKEHHTIKKLIVRSTQIAVFFIVLWFAAAKLPISISGDLTKHFPIAQRAIVYASILSAATIIGFGIAISRKKYMTGILLVLLILHTSDLFYAFQKFNPFSPKELIFPTAPITEYLRSIQNVDRYWGLGSAGIEANFATQLSLYSPDGYDPLYPRWYGEFIQSSIDGKIHTAFTRGTRSDATIASSSEKEFPTNPYRMRVLNILGVRYILDRTENLSDEQVFPINRFSPIYDKDGWKILANREALPRAFLVKTYQVYTTKEEFEKTFFDERFDLSSVILIRKNLGLQIDSEGEKGNASISSYNSNTVNIKTSAPGSRLLFLSDVFYPGWKAFVDNKETPIYQADWAFRAIYVPKGEHVVRFTYDPLSWKIGLWISALSVLTACIMILKLPKIKT